MTNENKTDFNNSKTAVMLFAFITMLLAFGVTFVSALGGFLLMFVFFLGDGILIALAYGLLDFLKDAV